MASYAKQAQDETLYNHAVKIRTRATNQCGVLLKQHPKATTNHKGNKGDKKTPAPGFSKGRTQAAKDAGLSRRQAETAIAIASIPKKKFEALVESPKPPTITKLAEIGTKKRKERQVRLDEIGSRDPGDFRQMLNGFGLIERMAEKSDGYDVEAMVRGSRAKDRRACLRNIETSKKWLSKLERRLKA